MKKAALWLPAPNQEVLGVERNEAGWIVSVNGHGDATCPACRTQSGSRHSSYLRSLDDFPVQGTLVMSGREVDRVSTFMLPNIMSVPNTQHEHGKSTSLGFVVPVDDPHCRIVSVRRISDPENAYPPYLTNGKKWSEMTIEERQDFPNDFEAQMGQGPISLHSNEHLATSDAC
jgi:hypothetical protein